MVVLIGHARGLLWMAWNQWKLEEHGPFAWAIALGSSIFRYGHDAVLVFFCLSGFFIHLALAQRSTNDKAAWSVRSYFKRRANRILPTYFGALVFTVAVDIVGRSFFADFYSGKTGDPLIDENLNHSNYTLASVVPAILLQPSLLGVHFGSDGPLWSIACEVFYYAAYPAFAMIWIKNRLLAYVIALSLGFSCWIYPWAGYWSGTVCYFPIWILGALLAEHFVAYHSKFDFVAFVIALFLSGILFLAINLNLPEKVLLACRMGLAIAATTLFVSLPKWLSTSRIARLFEWLGVRSYSIYVFHMPLITLLCAWTFHNGIGRPAHGWFALVGATAGVAAGLIGFETIEKRFLNRKVARASIAA